MIDKLNKLTGLDWFGAIFWALVGCIVGFLVGYAALSSYGKGDLKPSFILGGVSFLLTFIFVVNRMMAEVDKVEQRRKRYLLENPTVAEYETRYSDLHQELFDQNPQAFNHYCVECAGKMRVSTKLKTVEYDPATGMPAKQILKIFCSNDSDHKKYEVYLFHEKKKKFAQFQGEHLLVVEDDGTNARLPKKLESIR